VSDINDIIQDLTNPFKDIEEGFDATEAEVIEFAHFIGFMEALVEAATDPKTWASLGWIALGVILMIMGARMLFGKSALPSFPAVIPV
jgi:hypothetical protein